MLKKKDVPAYVLFVIAVVLFGASFIVDGVLGGTMNTIGIIVFIFAIITWVRELARKRKAKSTDSSAPDLGQ